MSHVIYAYTDYCSNMSSQYWYKALLNHGQTAAEWSETQQQEGRNVMVVAVSEAVATQYTAGGYTASSPLVMRAVTAHDLANPSWHSLPDGHAWVGEYIPVLHTPNDGRVCITTDEGEPVRYSCPHCAYAHAQRVALAEGSGGFTIIGITPGAAPEDCFMPPGPEVVGDPVVSTTATRKDVTAPLPNSCGNCGQLGHNVRTCEAPPHSHLKIGIEIEGRFLDFAGTQARYRAAGLTGCGDGSIHSSPDSRARPYEIQTKPGSLREALDQLVSFYPDEADSSCGMHVHVSFPATDLTVLNSSEFFTYFKERWTTWGTANRVRPGSAFWRRLRGDVDYCLPNTYNANRDVTACDRYVQLNFNAWSEHETVECRMLPMFAKQSLGVSAVQELISIYETFLATKAAECLPPELDVEVDAPDLAPSITNATIDVQDLITSAKSFEMELADVLPPRPGTIRIPAGLADTLTLSEIRERRVA